MPMQNNEYMCKLNGAVFNQPCTVTACFAHISNLTQSGVKPISTTNCAHADFALAGFSENLDYAIEEQGFVGFRDLQYLSPFLNVNANDLREIYTNNVTLLRKYLSILWAAKDNNTHFCKLCGHPIRDQSKFQCVSTTICEVRLQTVSRIVEELIKITPSETYPKIFNVLWRSRYEKFSPPIHLSEDELSPLKEL